MLVANAFGMCRCRAIALFFGVLFVLNPLFADGSVSGTVSDLQAKPVAGVRATLAGAAVITAVDGAFRFDAVPPGSWELTVQAQGFAEITRPVDVADGRSLNVNLQFERLAPRTDTVTVTAEVTRLDVEQPDPAQRIYVREEILDANPGRPGAPVSIPGLPIETPAGGIKAPQYFAPGVAGDHGEPIATFLQVGSFLLPNNLSANAHGNGYSDPNIMVPAIIEGVQTDGGAFNVREGNHSVDLAATYVLRPNLRPFATLTADYRDVDLSAGWNWFAMQASFGNGFLETLEHRRQYKFNILKSWNLEAHRLTLLFLGYYGESKIPGLVPIEVPDLHDTIDIRQRDQTHTGEMALNDVWHLGEGRDLQLSTFFRTYNLDLFSNFGDGLIRQGEFRTESGDNATYIQRFGSRLSVMAGFDYLREAPRRDNLDHYISTDQSYYGPFYKVDSNDLTLNLLSPFVAVNGTVFPWLRYNLGWRRDQINVQNKDLLVPANSFYKWIGINSPKVTISFVAPDSMPLPSVSLSFGQAFFTNDPRIGLGSQQGSLVSQAHAYQAVVSKTIWKTDFRVTLGHLTQEASLAKIDPDTGLQEDEGPSRNQYITVSARRYFGAGFIQGLVSKADARDLSDGLPVPEAPRLIIDVLGTLEKLPFHLHARAEYEEVGGKPLGDGFVAVPLREFRCALVRGFRDGTIQAGVHGQIASGYTGQTLETLALPGEAEPFERIVGIYVPSYVTASVTWHFRP